MSIVSKIFGMNAAEKTTTATTTTTHQDPCTPKEKDFKPNIEETPSEPKSSTPEQEPKQESSQEKQPSDIKKMRIHNLIIVDESGSMSVLRNSTLSGVNETINTIREAQKEHADTQEHFLTLVTFDSPGTLPSPSRQNIRTIFNAIPIDKVPYWDQYTPRGCTPLYDALGISLTTLRSKILDLENTMGIVTILTDGLENSSHEWNSRSVSRLIDELKEEGWTFSYMGSDHDVKSVSEMLSIDNVVEFAHDEMGTGATWDRESASRKNMYKRLANLMCEMPNESWESKKEKLRTSSRQYYSNRVTPELIEQLQENEVFVFGSNQEGNHNGGGALFAVHHFGAIIGQGEGPQGQSYAIPTDCDSQATLEAVRRFCEYAREHPEKRFLVTQVGCGAAGRRPNQMARVFVDAVKIENISLPASFWSALGLTMM